MREINKKELFCLLFILVLACFFRLYKLDSIPPGIYPDEALNGNQAILEPGKIFYPENNGREGLFMNLVAISFKIFGPSIWSLKIVSATIGIFTVFGIYLLTKELFSHLTIKSFNQLNAISLLSAFFLSLSFWHVNFSRISFRAILVPLISIFAFYWFLKALKGRNAVYFIISGILFGLGLYTYIAFRVIFLALPVLFIMWYKGTKRQKIEIAYFLCSILIVSLPLMTYFLKTPEDFISRAAGVSVFSQENPIKAFSGSLIAHLLMFNFKGDQNWRHNIAGSPSLFWPVGILFLIGLTFSIKESIKTFRNKNYSLLTTYYLLISWWFVMLLPAVFTYEGIPHALRCIGAIPPTFILAGLGGILVFDFVRKSIPFETRGTNAYVIIPPLILLGLSFILAQYSLYFEVWAKDSNLEWAFTKQYVDIGNYLNSLPAETKKYVIVNEIDAPLWGISIPAQAPMFIETCQFGQPRSTYLKAEELDKIAPDKEKVVIVPLYDGKMLIELTKRFPQAAISQKNGFFIYEIN